MKKYISLILASAFFAGAAAAAPGYDLSVPASAKNASTQQERMKVCNKVAGERSLQGQQRKDFMKACLSKNSEAKQQVNSQQQKMSKCNALAKDKNLSGEKRKAFMSSCLKK